MVSIPTVGGDQLAPGSKRAVPGWFHINITQIGETEKLNGLTIHLTVLAGKPNDPAVTDFVDSTCQLTFWYADASRTEDEQARSNAKLTALLIATDLITPAQLGQPVEVNEQLAVGCHALVHLRYKQKKEGDKWVDDTRYLDLAFSDILHIDDPAGKDVPKNIAALKFVPAARRHPDPKYFAFKAKPSAAAAGGGNAVGGGSQAAAGSPAAAGGVPTF